MTPPLTDSITLTVALLAFAALVVVGGIGFPRVVLGAEGRRDRRRRAARRRMMRGFPGLRNRLNSSLKL